MATPVISVNGLGKRYQIGALQRRHDTLRDSVMANLSGPARWLRGAGTAADETIWALRDVSFDVQQGEVLGIIGRNGAGKSTLLKILSRITRPTEGFADLRGRVGSLLEVGTGFHPELTGRENIVLNGAILGMRRSEISRQFDAIVAFAEVEKFIDTPVKRYSSGMYVRLAFAVAAHLTSDILIIDEVLAVGDISFQRKCLGMMGSIAGQGRTILFVSHNMQAVRQICSRVCLIEDGHLAFDGAPAQAITRYFTARTTKAASAATTNVRDQSATTIDSLKFTDHRGQEVGEIDRSEELWADLEFTTHQSGSKLDIAMAILFADGTPVFSETFSDQASYLELEPARYSVRFEIPTKFLKPEPYFLTVFLVTADGQALDRLLGVALPEITARNDDSLKEARRWGVVRIPIAWTQPQRIS